MNRVIYCAIAVALFISSCKKETQTEYRIVHPDTTSSTSITLSIEKVINDSTITLKWNKTGGPRFKQYMLARMSTTFQNGSFINNYTTLKTFSNPDSLSFTEKSMPFAPDIQYTVYSQTDSVQYSIYSSVTYHRPNTYITAAFSDIVPDIQHKVMYMISRESGTVTAVDYANYKLIKTVNVGNVLGYSALGSYNGTNNELYLPTADGWLYIYDTATLTLKDKIYVQGPEVGSVVAADGLLFVSSSDMSYDGFYDNAVKIYDRKTKKVLGITGVWDYTRLMLLPNSKYKLIDITFNLAPTDLNLYTISADGKPLTKTPDSYHGDHALSGNILSAFPDGSHFITAASGAVYTKDLLYEKDMARPGSAYTDFAVNNAGNIIYAASANTAQVDLISYPSGTILKSLKTKLYPAKLFIDGNQLICITADRYHGTNNYAFFVEKFNL
ncbi:YncE family protein [Mucilaginibacter angelicae]|uniref:YncE family protein n=1 Tax=Mucilaginibacter angelicae TaxID=869718 RepID=A0ABV6L7W2_9SPHI